MADRVKVKVRGLRETQRNMRALSRNTARRVEMAVEDSADQVVSTASRLVPVKTSRLLRTINQQRTAAPRGTIRHVVGADTEYARFLEDPEGNRKHRSRKGRIGKPTPFLFPAVQLNFKNIERNVTKAVRAAIRESRAK